MIESFTYIMGLKESRIPTFKGIRSAFRSTRFKDPDSRQTDLMGNAGVNLVFPEFSPLAPELQHIITLGHQIDHISDEGILFHRQPLGETNIATFNILFSDFIRRTKDRPELLGNIVSFLSQASTVEKRAHKIQDPTV